jgi:CheY-specific phosphatase CheX
MATRIITIPFAKSLNVSLHASKEFVAGEDRAHDQVYKKASNGTVTHLGDLVTVNKTAKTIDVSVDASLTKPVVSSGEFIFFGKNQTTGTSGMTGYYAEVEMKNDSTSYAELFAVSSEVFESSK